MNWVTKLKKCGAWLVAAFLSVVLFLFAESWLILAAKVFGPILGILVCFSIMTPIVWLIIFLAYRENGETKFRNWITEQETKLSKKMQIAAKYGKFMAIVFTAVTLGPILSAILMLLLGYKCRNNFVYSTLCSLLCYVVWVPFYSGVWWGIARILRGGVL